MAMSVRPSGTNRPTVRSAPEKSVIVDSIRSIAQELRATGKPVDEKLGVTAAQLEVLRALDGGKEWSVNDLAERTFTHQSTVSSIVGRLAEVGLISRTSSRDDARRQAITLTTAGKGVLRRAPDSSEDRLLAALRGMNREELRNLATCLERLSTALTDRAED